MSYREQFLAGSVPATLDLSGDWVVKGLLGPVPVRFLGHTKQFRPHGDGVFEGNNRFLGRLRTGYYHASIGPSQLDPELQVININYDRAENPSIMRGLTDEVRFIDEHTLLGRGVYKASANSQPRVVFWFTVAR
jgi:hypothetical protein